MVKENKLPSRHQINAVVKHILIDEKRVNRTEVIKVHFTENQVSYDLELECFWPEGETPKPGFGDKVEKYYYTRLYNVPSSFVIPVEEKTLAQKFTEGVEAEMAEYEKKQSRIIS